MEDDGHSADRLAAAEVRSRAARGAALLWGRGAFILGLGLVANLVLARLLQPRDFGIFALGLVLVTVGTYLAEGGLGAALIRREAPPRRTELEAVASVQLGATTLLFIGAAGAAIPLGGDALMVAAMSASLPIAMLRAPSVIVLERGLEYSVIAGADVVEAVSFYATAIAAAAAGLGAWGLVAAVVVRAAAGSATVLMLGPLGIVRPRWRWAEVRPLLGFGVKFQAAGLTLVGREQILNVMVAAVAGLTTLGVWNLAWRVMQGPAVLFQTVGRVAFPAMSQLLAGEHDPRSVIERQVALVSAVNGLVVVAVVGFASALPGLIGNAWSDVPAVLLWSGIAVVVGAPVVVTATGYLLAAGEPGAVVSAAAGSTVVWLVVATPLVGVFGAPAVGMGWVAAAAVSATFLWHRVSRRLEPEGVALSALAIALPLGAVAAAWLVAHQVDDRVLGGAVGLAVGESIEVLGLVVLQRSALRQLRDLGRQALRSFGALRG